MLQFIMAIWSLYPNCDNYASFYISDRNEFKFFEKNIILKGTSLIDNWTPLKSVKVSPAEHNNKNPLDLGDCPLLDFGKIVISKKACTILSSCISNSTEQLPLTESREFFFT